MKHPRYHHISVALSALENCEKLNNEDRAHDWRNRISTEMIGSPSGSGFDNGTYLSYDESKPERLVFTTAFHHMNSDGYYIGWTEHKVIITPSLQYGFLLRITGKNYRGIKEYM